MLNITSKGRLIVVSRPYFFSLENTEQILCSGEYPLRSLLGVVSAILSGLKCEARYQFPYQ
jgi:hypothetical protein